MQPILKYLHFIYNRRNIEKLLNNRLETFCTQNILEISVVPEDEKTYNIIKLFQRIFLICTIGADILFMLRPLLFQNSLYILETWTFRDSIVINTIVLVSQYYVLLLIIPIIFGYDILYLSFSVNTVIEVRRLKNTIKNLFTKSSRDIKGDLIICIKRHQYLKS